MGTSVYSCEITIGSVNHHAARQGRLRSSVMGTDGRHRAARAAAGRPHAAVASTVVSEVIYRTATSFNGFIADENHSLDWLFAVDHAEAPNHAEFIEGIGVMVEGSTTYEWVLRQTDVLSNPERWGEFYGARPTFVFTSRRLQVPDGADVRFINGAIEDALPTILGAAGAQDVWLVGGGELAGQF